MGERDRLLKILPWVSTPLLLVLTVVAWKLFISVRDVSPTILPQPEDVARATWQMLGDPVIWSDIRVTLMETLYGFGIAVVTGVLAGTVLGRIVWLERAVQPMIVALQVVPKVAFVPMFVIWFGFGMTSKIIMAAILAFFPIMLNVLLGVRSVDPGHVEVMRSLNASRWATFWRLELHSTLPYVFAGMEVGIVFAVIGALVGEYLGGSEGLGYMVQTSLNALDAESLFVAIVLLAVLGFALFFVITILKRFAIPWHQSVVRREDLVS
jgi:NitT/TauT family transport system permease protein